MTRVFVAGVQMTRFMRHPDRSLKDLVHEAVSGALSDAGLNASRVRAAFFGNTVQGTLEGQIMIRGQVALRPLGLEGIPVFNVENACASGSSAMALGVAHIKAGLADVVLAVGADKMVVPDKKTMLGVFDGAWDVHDTVEGRRRLLELGATVNAPDGISEMAERSFFMDVYAAFAKVHMGAFGTTMRQIAAVSAKNHAHSVFNPLAQYQRSMSIGEVLAAPSVVWPLTLPMCAPVSDGAAAVILCSEEALAPAARQRAVEILSATVLTGVTRDAGEFDRHLAALGARRAYEEAGIGPEDISVAEVHDATAFAEIQQIENLGFCDFGEGGSLTESGYTSLGGRLPVNPSGGLESKGHPIAATGLGQIFELVTQLRGEAGARQVAGARFAIAENGGGLYGIEEAVASITILGDHRG